MDLLKGLFVFVAVTVICLKYGDAWYMALLWAGLSTLLVLCVCYWQFELERRKRKQQWNSAP